MGKTDFLNLFDGEVTGGKQVSQEPQLVPIMDTWSIDIDESFERDCDDLYGKFYGDTITDNVIDPWGIIKWRFYFHFDNWFPLTINIKPDLWGSRLYINNLILDYCKHRNINIYYTFENITSNLHIHGMIGFPSGPIRKRFQVWVNKYLGKYNLSTKTDDGTMWFCYVHKQIWHKRPAYIDVEIPNGNPFTKLK